MVTFALDPCHDAGALARDFARDGRVTIDGLIDEASAVELYRHLQARDDWRHIVINEDKLVELDRATRAGLTDHQREILDQAVYGGAQSGFQARYDAIRVPDDAADRSASDDLLVKLAEWLSSGTMRDFLRAVTGDQAITFADAQATAYSPGDFLTGHDDVVEEKRRSAAYVFGLTPQWRIEWGGLLLFHQGPRVTGISPGFNQLNLFRVGQLHSVSEVTRAAPVRRYSVTGWLRRQR